MTIALGIIADDGVVIAADRQETDGDQKKDNRKIDSLWAIPVGALVVAGAGDGPYIDSMTTRLQYCFGEEASDPSIDVEEMTMKFRASHSAFYSEAVLPFAGYQPYERPDYELLFGCSIGARHLLWYSHKLTLNQAQGFRAVGVGASTAESLLKKFYVLRLPLKIVISLAAFVVYQVKNSVEGCGFETDILFTKVGIPPCHVSPLAVKQMEEAFAKYRLLERDELYKCIGGGIMPKNRDARGWNKFRRDLKKPFDSFYEGFDEVYPRNPPEPTQSTSQKSEPEP